MGTGSDIFLISGGEMMAGSEEFNSILLSNAPNPILVINPDTSIKYVNPALEELTGFTSPELIGRKAPYPWWDEADVEKVTRQLVSEMRLGGTIERVGRKRNGQRFWIEVSSRPIVLDGEFKYFLSNWVDITRRRQAEQNLNKLNEELRNLYSHMQSVREEERAQIAREVHDEFGQSLTALKMDVCWLQKKLTGGEEPVQKTMKSMNELIDQTLQKVKWISTRLRPGLLDDIGLKDAIEWLAAEFQAVTGIQCLVSSSQDVNALGPERSTAIFRVFQETLTNVFRHAEASRVLIDLKRTPRAVLLKMEDNGKGITREQVYSPRAFGLIGMREYVYRCGGTIKVKGVANKGTTITVRIPVKKEKTHD